MMDHVRFLKGHGTGNDFVLLPDLDGQVTLTPGLVAALCDRRRGIGADGLLVGETEPAYAARMVLYNADGSRAEMSGNGIRCFAQALAARRGDTTAQRILTDAGERVARLRPTDDPDTLEISVDMGPVERIAAPEGWAAVGCHPDRPAMHLSVGNPHTVVGVDDVAVVDLPALGTQLPHVNLEIVEPGPEPHAVTMRVHERGAGITEACGTGACAVAYAAVSWGLVPATAPEILVHMDGGSARVALDTPATGRVTLTGPATMVATITIIDTSTDTSTDSSVGLEPGAPNEEATTNA
jgi:diaminopimelate epimerase